MKTNIAAIITFILFTAWGGLAPNASAKPAIKLDPDKFPTGHETPEGAACDFARAVIRHDVALFTNSCLKPFADGEGSEKYVKFLRDTIGNMKLQAAKTRASPDQLESIGKVYAARHLRKSTTVSYGRATYGFQDVMFVDVGMYTFNGGGSLARTLVIKDKDGKWYAFPSPDVSPQLATGLSEEKPSRRDFSAAYDVPD